MSEEEQFDAADVVFTGEAVDSDDASWTFDVESAEKGGAAPQMAVKNDRGNTCFPGFKAGERYQVYAHRDDDGLFVTSICDGTKLLAAEETPFAEREPVATRNPDVVRGRTDDEGRVLIPGRGEGTPPPAGEGGVVRGPRATADRLQGEHADPVAPHAVPDAHAPASSKVRDYLITFAVWGLLAIPLWLAMRRRRHRRAAGGAPA